MFVDQSTIFLEIVEPLTGTPVNGCDMGEVVITFMNGTTPFVRLATGDLSHISSKKSDRIAGIFGRADSSVKVKGVFVHPWQFDELASGLGCLLQLNVVSGHGSPPPVQSNTQVPPPQFIVASSQASVSMHTMVHA